MKNLNYVLIILMSLSLINCSSAQVREQDLNSWTGHSEDELNKHPLFSALHKEEQNLKGDEKIINFVEKKVVAEGPSRCVGASSGIGFGGIGLGLGSTVCDERQYRESNCVHQFSIKDEKVVIYRVLGENNCYTTCKNTPEHDKCKK